jgi:hypothetical protein
MQAVCVVPTRGRRSSGINREMKEKLRTYYDTQILGLHLPCYPKPTYTYLNTVLDYAAENWYKDITNNIIQRYVVYVETFVNFQFNKKGCE